MERSPLAGGSSHLAVGESNCHPSNAPARLSTLGLLFHCAPTIALFSKEEPCVRSARSDAKRDQPQTPRAAATVSGAL